MSVRFKETRNTKTIQYKTQYLYSTESVKRSISRNDGTMSWAPRGKAGETTLTADERIRQQDGTIAFEKPVKLDEMRVPHHISDGDIRNHLIFKMGMREARDDASREWVSFVGYHNEDDMIQVWRSAINELVEGVARPWSFPMREEQQECHDKAVTHFKTVGSYQFLINAKMRFGKTFTSYEIVKTLAKHFNKKFKVLVLTYKPTVEAGWAEDLQKHVDFDGWAYSFAGEFDKNNPVTIGDADVEVLFASFQDLNDMDKAKWKNITDYHFDMLIIDEQHYGTQTEKAKKTLKTISFDRVLEVSGTPLHALMSGRFENNEIYSWSYADEQRKRKAEMDAGWSTDIYRWLPQMKFMTFQISEDAKKQCSFYTNVEGFTMNKMYASNDGETFIDEAAVTMWIEEAYGINCHKNKSPVKQYNSDHMVWKLPSVASCKAMNKLLKRLGYVKHVPIVVSGDKGANLSDVHKHIAKYDKTVTLTCGSLMTGTTVPEWDMIFMLDSGSSAQDYFQTIFRVQSSNKKAGKEMCYVVDYNPQRNIQAIYDYCDIQAKTSGGKKSTQQFVAEFLDFAPIMDHTGNKPVKKDVEELLDTIARTSNAIEKFASAFNVNYNNADIEVRSIFADIKQDANSKRDVDVSDNDIAPGKNKTSNTNRNTPNVDTTAKEEREFRQKVITVQSRIPNYLWVEKKNKNIDNARDIVYSNSMELFQREVGISLSDFEVLLDKKLFGDKLDMCILDFKQTLKRLTA